MKTDLWAEADNHLNECFKAYYKAVEDAKEVHRQSVIAHEKWIEAADEAEKIAKWTLRFARKRLLSQEGVNASKTYSNNNQP